MEMASEPFNPIRIKQEPVDDLTVVIKTEPEWQLEGNSTGLPDCTKNAGPEMLQEDTHLYPPVKQEPVENAFQECEADKSNGNLNSLVTCNAAVKREITEQIVKKEELSDYPDCLSPLQVLSEEEREKKPNVDTKKNVLVNLVPFLKQELDCNLHSIHKRRSSSVTADSCSQSTPVLDDSEDSASDFPESPRLVIAEAEDTANGEAADELSEPRNLLGDGWRVTVFRCGHCMTLAWDVVRLARHDCSVRHKRKLNSTILGQLRQGTQVKYVNLFGCNVCGKVFFKRKNYRKHVSTMHSEEMLRPFVKIKPYSEGDGCDPSLCETPRSSFTAQLRSDTCGVNSLETHPKLAHEGNDVSADDSALSDLQSSDVENGDSLNVCVVCSRESCQMHKYGLIRGKYDVTENTPTFMCRTCVRYFQCEENYWRHMYYHGFKAGNVFKEEPAAVSQSDSTKKKVRRPRKRSGSFQGVQCVDSTCENISSPSFTSSQADFFSLKSGSLRESTGVASTSVTTAEVCFAPADACEIHNPPSTADRTASINNKRRLSAVSLTTEEDGPDPKKKRCILPTVEQFSPADNCVTPETDMSPGCSSPQRSSEGLWPDSSLAGDVCGSVSTSQERDEGSAVEGESSYVALDDVTSERLEKNECSLRGAENGEVVEIIAEKQSEEHNVSNGTVHENVSAVTNGEEMCSSPSPQVRKINQTAIEVIDIDDDDEDEGRDGDDNLNYDGRDDKTSSFPESDPFQIEEKHDGEKEAVSGQENVEQGSYCSSNTSEHPDKSHAVLQNMEVDSTVKDQEEGLPGSTVAGEMPQSTACKVTIGGLQPIGIPFVRAGVSYGTRVAVLKCVNTDNNGPRLGHEKQAAIGCEGRTGTRVLQVSNTAVYQTVPVRQVGLTNLTFVVPTVRGSENSEGTVGNLRRLSELSLNTSGTPRTGTCLLKCEKCNLMGAYGPAFFSHKCSPSISSGNNGSKVLPVNGVRVVTNGPPGLIYSNSKDASSQTAPCCGAAANTHSTGTVVWKCVRCNFATIRSDVFKSHVCESVVGFKIFSDGQMAGAGMRSDVVMPPLIVTRSDAVVPPRIVTRSDAVVPPCVMTRSDAVGPPRGVTRSDAVVPPRVQARSDAVVPPRVQTRSDAVVPPRVQTRSDAVGLPCVQTRSDAVVPPRVVARSDAVGPPRVVAGSDAVGPPRVVAGSDAVGPPRVVARSDAVGPPRVVARSDAVGPPCVQTRSDAVVQTCIVAKSDAVVQTCVQTRSDAVITRSNVVVPPRVETRSDTVVPPRVETRSDADVPPRLGTRSDADVPPRLGTRNDAGMSSGDGTRRDADLVSGADKKSETNEAPAPPVDYRWKCMGCSLLSNSRQCLLMHKCSSFKRKATGPDAVFASGPELMCRKCGFKTAGRLMFGAHQCDRIELPAWFPRDKVEVKKPSPPPKVCEKSPQIDSPDSVHQSVLKFLCLHGGAKMVENNGSFLVMLPNMSALGSPARVGS